VDRSDDPDLGTTPTAGACTEATANDCSLRGAITAANTTSGADTINFNLGSPATITLVISQLPLITDSAGLTIDGGSADITIDGGAAVRPFLVDSGAKLSLNELTLTKGNTSSNDGGAIRNEGTLVVSNSTLSRNTSANQGGAIFNQGTLEVSDSTLSRNRAKGDGGAISSEGTLVVSNSTLSGNSTQSKGGAIANRSSGTATVSNSTLSGNSASNGGAMSNERVRGEQHHLLW
jgi:predicted outer membrane repeat protein